MFGWFLLLERGVVCAVGFVWLVGLVFDWFGVFLIKILFARWKLPQKNPVCTFLLLKNVTSKLFLH